MQTSEYAVDATILAAMRAFGAPAHDIARAEALAAQRRQEAPCEVWPDNAASLNAYLGVSTQWVYSGGLQVRRTRLDYSGVEAWLRTHAHPRRRRALFADITLMEHAVLLADQELHERRH